MLYPTELQAQPIIRRFYERSYNLEIGIHTRKSHPPQCPLAQLRPLARGHFKRTIAIQTDSKSDSLGASENDLRTTKSFGQAGKHRQLHANVR